MDTAEAIRELREKMGIGQQELADRLGVTVTSISRYENGRKPARQTLKKLGEVAHEARLSQLQKLFKACWQAEIAQRVQNLRSTGTERPVSIEDLKYWQWVAQETVRSIQIALTAMAASPGKDLLEIMQHDQKRAKEQIEVYIHGRKK